MKPIVLHVAVPSPLRRHFDYLPPAGAGARDLAPGMRVQVPFGRRQVTGVVLRVSSEADLPVERLKPASTLLDPLPLFPEPLFRLLEWASRYYHHPVGEVFAAALPVLLRQGRTAMSEGERRWRLTGEGVAADPAALGRAPRQQALLGFMQQCQAAGAAELEAHLPGWRETMRRLQEKGWVVCERSPKPAAPPPAAEPKPRLNEEQRLAVEAIAAGAGFNAFLLNGVTGSGKTEVYLSAAEAVIAAGRQVLMLVPEIGLTPQLLARLRQRFAVPVAVLHSGLNDRERLDAWLLAGAGEAPLVIGTRSAVFTPLKQPGLIVVDEEHDASLKQQEGFRYSGRDVAVMRARLEGVPIVLGSATPSLESLHNVELGRYRELRLTRRAGEALAPAIQPLDLRQQPMQEGLSRALLEAMRGHLERQGQVLLFLNRRGYAPALLCHDCGWSAECKRCDTHMVLHRQERRLRCHHCARDIPLMQACPACGSGELRPVGQGTQRIEQALREHFPEASVVRIDRDSTRRKGALEGLLDEIHQGRHRILIGTQMLAKGHHFPDVTLVGILDADQGLYSADFRGIERMAQQVMQVAGRAGRAQRPGTVILQTHHPDNPLLRELLAHGYDRFARALLAERRQADLPPYAALALLRAEAVDAALPLRFLERARVLGQARAGGEVQLLGPVAAPMERRAGRYRAQLLAQSASRAALHRLLEPWLRELEACKDARKVRWSLDVDPVEMF